VNAYLGDIDVPSDPALMDFNAWFGVYLDMFSMRVIISVVLAGSPSLTAGMPAMYR
jgi:hypothetical protein